MHVCCTLVLVDIKLSEIDDNPHLSFSFSRSSLFSYYILISSKEKTALKQQWGDRVRFCCLRLDNVVIGTSETCVKQTGNGHVTVYKRSTKNDALHHKAHGRFFFELWFNPLEKIFSSVKKVIWGKPFNWKWISSQCKKFWVLMYPYIN